MLKYNPSFCSSHLLNYLMNGSSHILRLRQWSMIIMSEDAIDTCRSELTKTYFFPFTCTKNKCNKYFYSIKIKLDYNIRTCLKEVGWMSLLFQRVTRYGFASDLVRNQELYLLFFWGDRLYDNTAEVKKRVWDKSDIRCWRMKKE